MKNVVFLLTVFFLAATSIAKGQGAPALPVRNIQMQSIQELSFGDIAINSNTDGSVTVDYNGIRSSSGSNLYIMELGTAPRQAVLTFRLCPGRSVQVIYSPTFYLTRSQGGETMLVTLGPMKTGTTVIQNSGQSFTSNKGCNDQHILNIGAILTVKSLIQNPAGDYTGSFQITFAHE